MTKKAHFEVRFYYLVGFKNLIRIRIRKKYWVSPSKLLKMEFLHPIGDISMTS